MQAWTAIFIIGRFTVLSNLPFAMLFFMCTFMQKMKAMTKIQARVCRNALRYAVLITVFLTACITAGCSGSDKNEEAEAARMAALFGENRELPAADSASALAVRADNGWFVGRDLDGVLGYKGIPYAMPPVGPLRWHAPVAAPAGNSVRQAYYFGYSAIQTEALSQYASYYPQSEDCLTLNVWTAPCDTLDRARRAVMVYIHGGSYGWGGTSDPMFDGRNLVAAHPDVVLVSINYRLGIFGFLDLTNLKGGEAYTESANLGMLDQIAALKWVRRNIAQFGGDPDNVTIFGQSAGGGSVSLLTVMEPARGLFRRAIAESGSVALTSSKAQACELTDMLVRETGIDSVQGLMALGRDELVKINRKLSAHNRFPMRDGRLIPLDPYRSYLDGAARDIDFMTGTNKDEACYWIGGMGGYYPFRVAINVWYENIMKGLPETEQKRLDDFCSRYPGGRTRGRVEFINDLMFRIPSTLSAADHARSGGRTYNYYFTKASYLPHRGAGHCMELAYVFGNLGETQYTGGPVDTLLSRRIQNMWVNFAKTGDPSADSIDWPEYNPDTRLTMVLGDTVRVESRVLDGQRQLIEPLAPLFISPLYDTLSLNTPTVRIVGGTVLAVLVLIVLAIVYTVRRVRCKKR